MFGLSAILPDFSSGFRLPLADWTTVGMPEAKSTIAHMVDSHIAFINIVCAFFFIAICIALTYIIIRFKKPAGEKAESDVSHNTPLEVTWTVIPMIIVVIMFCVGFYGYNRMIAAPADSYTINVQAQQWSWAFHYPDGTIASFDPGRYDAEKNERLVTDADQGLHLPPGVPIRLKMTSADVLHAFYIPQFRVKQDIVPGKISTLWFEPLVPEGDEPDEYWLMCAEYCGKDHSQMFSRVYVHPTLKSFEDWKIRATSWKDEQSWEQRGEILYRRKGCKQCHSVDGTRIIGPTWLGLWGKTAAEHPVAIGGKNGPVEGIAVAGDAGEAYIFESIRDPMSKIVVGYDAAMIPQKLSDEEILYLIEFMKSLGTKE